MWKINVPWLCTFVLIYRFSFKTKLSNITYYTTQQTSLGHIKPSYEHNKPALWCYLGININVRNVCRKVTFFSVCRKYLDYPEHWHCLDMNKQKIRIKQMSTMLMNSGFSTTLFVQFIWVNWHQIKTYRISFYEDRIP